MSHAALPARFRRRQGPCACRRAFLVLAAAFGLSAAGCVGFDVKTDFDREVDFSAYDTFAWLEPPVTEPRELPEDAPAAEVLLRNSLLDKRLRAAVTAALERRGFRRVPESEAEMALRYRVAVESRTEMGGSSYATGAYYGYGAYPYYYGAGPGLGSYWWSRDVRDAILILDMVDVKTGQLIWRGWAVGNNRDAYLREEEIQEAVEALMDHFPPEREAD